MMDPVAGARAPLPIALLVVVAGVLAFSTDQPLVLGALAVGAVVLLLAAPAHPGHLVLIVGLISAAGVIILTPLVSGQGDLVLFSIPVPPPLNGEITAEEMGAGAAAAARLLATVAPRHSRVPPSPRPRRARARVQIRSAGAQVVRPGGHGPFGTHC